MPDHRVVPLVLTLAILLGACTVEPGSLPGQREPLALPDAPSPIPGFGLLRDHGVSDDACAAAVNPDNGCIRLGALVDRSGPLAAFGDTALAGARAFWRHVNEQGGVTSTPHDGTHAAFDVDLEEWVADTRYEVPEHLQAYEDVEPNVLALALSMGTPQTTAALHDHLADELVAAPLSAWSGWAFEALIAESGASYCLQAINGMDWALAQLGGGAVIDRVVVVHSPDHYGEDALAGVQHWADPDRQAPSRVPFDPAEHAVTLEVGGDVTAAVDRIVEVSPEVVLLAAGPQVTADVATGVADRGWEGMLVGVAPTFEPSLLDDPEVADALAGRYVRVGTVGPLSQGSRAHVEMRSALGLGEGPVDPTADGLPDNDAWLVGWIAQYPLHRALEEAIAQGDLTRAGLAEVVKGMTAKYDGALPWTVYDAAPDDVVTRRAWVYRPDRDALLGQELVAEAFVGDTAERVHVTRPCTEG